MSSHARKKIIKRHQKTWNQAAMSNFQLSSNIAGISFKMEKGKQKLGWFSCGECRQNEWGKSRKENTHNKSGSASKEEKRKSEEKKYIGNI